MIAMIIFNCSRIYQKDVINFFHKQFFLYKVASESTSHADRVQKVLKEPISIILPNIDSPDENEIHTSNHTDEIKTQCFWNIFYVSLVLILFFLFTFPVLLFPQHNSIQFQEYWYEPTILGIFTIILTFCIDTLVAIKYYFKADSYFTIKAFAYLFLSSAILWVIINGLCHYIWTIIYGYRHPIPLSLLLGYLNFTIHYVLLYFMFSQDNSWDRTFLIRFKALIKSRIWCIVIDLQYKGLSLLFNMLEPGIEWILAFILPLIREVNYNILVYIMFKSPKIEDRGEENVVIGMYGYSALYIAIRLGQTTTDITSILILLVDFSINLHSYFQIINLHRTIVPSVQFVSTKFLKMRDFALTKLVLTEIIEIIVPLSYLITMLLAYYGPNAEILGNIQFGCWQFQQIEDIGKVVVAVMTMFLIDSSSALIGFFWLWKSCSMNALEKTYKVIHERWDAIVGIIANFLIYVSIMCFRKYFYS